MSQYMHAQNTCNMMVQVEYTCRHACDENLHYIHHGSTQLESFVIAAKVNSIHVYAMDGRCTHRMIAHSLKGPLKSCFAFHIISSIYF